MTRPRQIILIDDDEDDREIFLTALQRIGNPVECLTFDNARIALDRLLDSSLTTDLIFLDLNMPVMNGQQFLVEIKKHSRLNKIPVIIFSTTSHWPTIQLMKDLGALHFLTKPEEFSDLITTLKTTLQNYYQDADSGAKS